MDAVALILAGVLLKTFAPVDKIETWTVHQSTKKQRKNKENPGEKERSGTD